ncbi:MAG: hypothetical protein D6B27_10640, partial [Gammaproteobacteria bacterium]
MKSFFKFLFLMVFLVSQVNAQSFTDNIKFSDFEKWAETLSIDGYHFMGAEQEGEAQYGEKVSYKAAFSKNKGMISISLEEIKSFQSNIMMAKSKQQPILNIGGKRGAFIPLGNASQPVMFFVEDADIPATVGIFMSPGVSKDKITDIYNSLDLSPFKKSATSATDWPKEIPEEARINANIAKIKSSAASTDGYKKEIKVVALMNDKLISELERIQKHYKTTSLSVIKVSNKVDLVCASGEEVKYLKQDFRENDAIEFIY